MCFIWQSDSLFILFFPSPFAKKQGDALKKIPSEEMLDTTRLDSETAESAAEVSAVSGLFIFQHDVMNMYILSPHEYSCSTLPFPMNIQH